MNNRRNLSSQLKTQLVMEYLKGQKSQAQICRENLISPSLFTKLLRQFQEKAHLIFENSKKDEQGQKIAKLEQIIGKQAIEIDFLKRGVRML